MSVFACVCACYQKQRLVLALIEAARGTDHNAERRNFVAPNFLNTVLVMLFTTYSQINKTLQGSNSVTLPLTYLLTNGSPFFFVTAPSLVWPSETGGELNPSVLEAWASDAMLEG